MYIDQVLKFADILIDYVRHVTTEIDALFADVLSDNGLTILQSRVMTEVEALLARMHEANQNSKKEEHADE